MHYFSQVGQHTQHAEEHDDMYPVAPLDDSDNNGALAAGRLSVRPRCVSWECGAHKYHKYYVKVIQSDAALTSSLCGF